LRKRFVYHCHAGHKCLQAGIDSQDSPRVAILLLHRTTAIRVALTADIASRADSTPRNVRRDYMPTVDGGTGTAEGPHAGTTANFETILYYYDGMQEHSRGDRDRHQALVVEEGCFCPAPIGAAVQQNGHEHGDAPVDRRR